MTSKKIVYEDNGNWASGFCEEYKSMLHICDKASSLSLVYNLCTEEEDDDDDEISHLCYVSEYSLNSSTTAEDNFEIIYGLVGRVITDEQIKAINKKFEPLVKEFREVREKMNSDDSASVASQLEHEYNILKMGFEDIAESETFWVSDINNPNHSPHDYYYGDPSVLDMIFSEAEQPIKEFIRKTAIEETFIYGILYHPDEIESTLSQHYEEFICDD